LILVLIVMHRLLAGLQLISAVLPQLSVIRAYMPLVWACASS